MKKFVLGICACLVVVGAAFGLVAVNAGVPADLKLHGYDPVSYFEADAPAEGSSAHAAVHGGATYYFASAENRATFLADPERFAPEYDGYCSYGVSLGQKFDIDPLAYRIVEGRLFVQLDHGTRDVWMQAEAENIQRADQNWPALKPLDAKS